MNDRQIGTSGEDLPESAADAPIAEFFAAFAAASAAEDWASYGEMFLPNFMNADPASAGPVARDDLIAFLPHRKGIFGKVGAVGTTLASLTIQHLDERHVLAETTWRVEYEPERKPETVPVLHSTFMLRREDRWRVAVYLNHNDLFEVLGVT